MSEIDAQHHHEHQMFTNNPRGAGARRVQALRPKQWFEDFEYSVEKVQIRRFSPCKRTVLLGE